MKEIEVVGETDIPRVAYGLPANQIAVSQLEMLPLGSKPPDG